MKREYTECNKCNRQISNSCYNRHYVCCDGNLDYWAKRRLGIINADHNIICKYCNTEKKNSNSRRNHERLCNLNPERQYTYLQNNKEEIKEKKLLGIIKKSNQFIKARELSLPVPAVSAKTRQKLSAANKRKTKECRIQQAIKSSETIKRKVSEGTWHTSLAQKMHYNYKGIDLHGKWELKYAKWLDSQNIAWERCKDQFKYIYNDKERKYTPDFYLLESQCYIEIKGYETDKDKAKWSQFPSHLTLKVLKEKELKSLRLNIR